MHLCAKSAEFRRSGASGNEGKNSKSFIYNKLIKIDSNQKQVTIERGGVFSAPPGQGWKRLHCFDDAPQRGNDLQEIAGVFCTTRGDCSHTAGAGWPTRFAAGGLIPKWGESRLRVAVCFRTPVEETRYRCILFAVLPYCWRSACPPFL
jgi:hypothetical protein